MIATIVSPSVNTLQILSLIAAIVFAVGAVIAAMDKAIPMTLTFVGLCLVALAIMFGF